MYKKDIWVGRLLLVTCSIFKQTSLIFFKTNTHISKQFINNENIFKKDKHLCIHSYERESLQRSPKQRPFYKILSKLHQTHFQNNKSKWSSKVTKSPWITTDRKGANTFPFYKSTSQTERNLKEGILLCFCPFHVGEYKRRWRLLLTAIFCKHKGKA